MELVGEHDRGGDEEPTEGEELDQVGQVVVDLLALEEGPSHSWRAVRYDARSAVDNACCCSPASSAALDGKYV